MPTPQQLDSLKALMGMGVGSTNAAYSRSALREPQLRDPRTTDAFRRLIMGEEADEAARTEADPMAQRYRQVGAGQTEAMVRDVPEIAAMREQQMAEKERLATAPARVTGQYNVEAAQVAGRERAALAEQQAERARQLAAQRSTATQQGQMQRQRNTQLESQAKTAETEGGLGLMDMLRGRPSAASRAAQLRSQQQFGEGPAVEDISGAEDQVSENPEIGEQGIIQGTPVEWDGIGWKVIE